MEDITAGDIIYVNSEGKAAIAKSTEYNTSVIGIAIKTVTAGEQVQIGFNQIFNLNGLAY